MKKRYIFLIVICLLFIILVWACSCKKTKALTGDEVNITGSYYVKGQTAGNNNGFIIVYDGSYVDNSDLLCLQARDVNNSLVANYGFYLSGSSNAWRIVMFNRTTSQQVATSPEYAKDKPIYAQLCYDYVDEVLYLYVNQINITFSGQQNITASASLSSNYWLINLTNINSNFNLGYLANDYSMYYILSWGSQSGALKALKLHYRYQILSYYSQEWDEQVEGAYAGIDDYINTGLYTDIFNTGYGEGYRAGYDEGYDYGYSTGYSAGETAGYNSGYSAGYSLGETYGYGLGRTDGYDEGYADGLADNAAGQTTAYNQGYDAGYADGYRYGQGAGFEEGFSTGYDRGLAEGLAGATPMSQATTLIGSIFAGIGSILTIQLFPGFPLGLLILVPLFFSVLGLILWIWRRN